MGDPARSRQLSAHAPGSRGLVPPGLDATLVLLRHGETSWIAEGRFQGAADIPLSLLGERQAALAAERLANPRRAPILPIPEGRPIEVVHSPLRRAARGAELVAAAIGAARGGPGAAPPLRPDPAFRELGQGRWEGLARTEIEATYPTELAAWRRTPAESHAPGGEPVPEVAARARDGLATLLGRLAAAPRPAAGSRGSSGYPPPSAPDTPWTLLVGHDGVFKTVLCSLLGLPLERFWSFPFGLCGISVVEFRDGMPVLRAHNLTEHLAPLTEGA